MAREITCLEILRRRTGTGKQETVNDECSVSIIGHEVEGHRPVGKVAGHSHREGQVGRLSRLQYANMGWLRRHRHHTKGIGQGDSKVSRGHVPIVGYRTSHRRNSPPVDTRGYRFCYNKVRGRRAIGQCSGRIPIGILQHYLCLHCIIIDIGVRDIQADCRGNHKRVTLLDRGERLHGIERDDSFTHGIDADSGIPCGRDTIIDNNEVEEVGLSR